MALLPRTPSLDLSSLSPTALVLLVIAPRDSVFLAQQPEQLSPRPLPNPCSSGSHRINPAWAGGPHEVRGERSSGSAGPPKPRGPWRHPAGQKRPADASFLLTEEVQPDRAGGGRPSGGAGTATHAMPPWPGLFWGPKATFHHVAQRGGSIRTSKNDLPRAWQWLRGMRDSLGAVWEQQKSVGDIVQLL